MKDSTIGISEFKAKCLRLLDEVGEKGHSLVITKKGRAIARVVPVSPPKRSLRGTWKGIVQLKGEIVNFDSGEEWEALGE